MTIRYKGTAYHGFQVQSNAVTVAQVFQDAVERVFGSRLDIKGCSRTDTGVHANQYCISMKTESHIPADRVPAALNINLPADIAVLSCEEVPEDFHARYDVISKQYIYKILNTPCRDPFWENLAYHYPYPLNLQLLNDGARQFIGTHDFTAFTSAGCTVKGDKVRTIFECGFTRQNEIVQFSVTGDGFLYHMVRIMVGTLLELCQGKQTVQGIRQAIELRQRGCAGVTAPACGLYLNQVNYQDLRG